MAAKPRAFARSAVAEVPGLTMTILTLTDLSAKLVELESHPGLEHVRRYQPTGVTAQRWALIDVALGKLWDDLADRRDDLERTNPAYQEVKEFFDIVDEINATVANRIAPALKQLDGSDAVVPKEVTDLLATSACDPLSLTADEIERRIASITELLELQEKWPEALTDSAIQLDDLRAALERAGKTRKRATQIVLTGPLPVAADSEPELRAQLESLSSPDPAALRELQRRIESAMQRVRQDEALAQGLLDRRNELKGRLRAYAAKAARVGLAGDAELSSARGVASGLLKHRPCDLRAVTQAVVDYQRLVSAKREPTR
jgi:hypothetical protein